MPATESQLIRGHVERDITPEEVQATSSIPMNIDDEPVEAFMKRAKKDANNTREGRIILLKAEQARRVAEQDRK